ncbi:MAG: hypothetical protein AAF127_10805 [Pseudomonadota bacterium]
MYKQECEALDTQACQALLFHEDREEVRRLDLSETETLYFACSGGAAQNCVRLGDKTFTGDGVVLDRDYAFVLYDRACALSDGYCELADANRTLPTLAQTCRKGNTSACAKAGKILYDGATIYSHDEAAREFLALACDGGIARSCRNAADATLR